MTKHIQFSLAAAALIVLSGSACMKKPELEDDDGPQAAVEEVQKAVVDAWGAETVASSILKDEFVQVNRSISLSDQPGMITEVSGISVVSVTTNAAEKTKSYQLVRRLVEIGQNNEQKVSTDERVVTVDAADASVAAASFEPMGLKAASDLQGRSAGDVSQNELILGIEQVIGLLKICLPNPDPKLKITCHNLKVWETTEDAPADLKAQPNCAGLPSCQVRKKNFGVDLILRATDPDTGKEIKVKEIYTAQIAVDAPYLSRLFNFCYQGLGTFKKADGKEQKIPLTVCDTVTNFIRGTP